MNGTRPFLIQPVQIRQHTYLENGGYVYSVRVAVSDGLEDSDKEGIREAIAAVLDPTREASG